MKLTLLVALCFITIVNAYSQGITLLYKGGGTGGWNDSLNWIQINTPSGQMPIQRAPTELDDGVFSSSQSGLTSIGIILDSILNVGNNNSTGARCRSMHVSNTVLSFDYARPVDNAPSINIYTSNGGFVLLDSGSNILHGYFGLNGGNPSVTDLTVLNSTYGILVDIAELSFIGIGPNAKARFVNSTLRVFHLRQVPAVSYMLKIALLILKNLH
jgi:hypothetical protein